MTQHSTLDLSPEIPYGYCHCGCGQQTEPAKRTSRDDGCIKGQPNRFVKGHQTNFSHGRPATERFLKKVAQAGPDECWNWTASTYSGGHGQFWTGDKVTGAHRYAYVLVNGPIPDGMHVCHRCDNRLCCNPAHLFLGTAQDNISDMHHKGRNRQPRGERQRSAKFTVEQVRQIREIHATGQYTYVEIARMFQVSPPTIRSIVIRENWRDV